MGASLPLKLALALVMLASAIELALISATVAYLAQLKNKTFTVFSSPSQTVHVPGLPAALLVDQGHTANGAAGTGLILIGAGGILALHLRGQARYYSGGGGGGGGRAVYRLWLALSVAGVMLTLAALAYVFALAAGRRGGGQNISLGAVVREGADGGRGFVYPVGTWTPQAWLVALLELAFVDAGDRDRVVVHERVARGWEYNLIPLFLVQLAQTVLALLDARRRRRAERGVYVGAGVDKESGYGAK